MRTSAQDLGAPRPGTEGSRALRARDRKRVRKGVPGVPTECATESEKSLKKSPKLRFWTLFGLWGHSLGTLGLPGPDTLSDSFRTLLGSRAREPSVPGRGVPDARLLCFFFFSGAWAFTLGGVDISVWSPVSLYRSPYSFISRVSVPCRT